MIVVAEYFPAEFLIQIQQETADWHIIQNALQEIGELTGAGSDPDVQIVCDTAKYIQNNV